MSSLDAKFNGQIFRYDQPMVLASNRQLAAIHGVPVKYDAAGLKAGQLVKESSTPGVYEKSAADGSDATAVLFDQLPVESFVGGATGTATARIITRGEVYLNALSATGAAAVTALGGKVVNVNYGVKIVSF